MEERKHFYPFYTDEENEFVHEYTENASEKELAELVRELQKLYEKDVPEIHKSFQQLEKEVRERDILYQKYEALIKCKTEWGKYITSLNNYLKALIIRKKYKDFKEKYGKRKGQTAFIFEYKENKSEFPECNEDFIKKVTIKKGKAHNYSYIKKPQPPYMYSSLDEIPVHPLSDTGCLEKIGKDNLKYLIHMMLSVIDTSGANTVPINISFLLCKYFRSPSHKSKNKLTPFAANIPSIPDLHKKNQLLLTEIGKKKEESKSLIAEIEEMEKV